ncbi:hypothetical protein COY32_06570 [candidate division WWE3 bacterium CG_4_10_14_0_2_um_filter_41_14]|uniref:Glycosyltransferase RgtA/B/C/D-like domain-containing protein n=1 Tax=candidate division WWE3 bacterium CG_4_10_14_0_2_um_filter_41_14 TaxID=1975072 RepID=A0A2M7TEY1_UNCKA|nr:MAG: hypothetical protein COY32_06570 [candidate division WWE3 bacterium CG_4_10_14_0_2_um_filter_41_14]
MLYTIKDYLLDSKNRAKVWIIIIILSVTCFGVVTAASLDGVVWLDAGKNFFDALSRGDFAATHYSSRFGISVMWLYGLSFIIATVTSFSVVSILTFMVYGFTVLCVFVLMHRVSRMAPTFPVYMVTSYLLLAPYVVATPIFLTWLDKILMVSTVLTILFWTEFLLVSCSLGTSRTRLIVLTGISLGVALLTKPAGIILIPLLIAMTAYVLWRDKSFQVIKPLLFVFGLAGFVFFVFYPAMWVDPLGVLLSRINSSDAQVELTIPFLMDNGFIRYMSNVVVVFLADLMFTVGVFMLAIDLYKALYKKTLRTFITPITFLGLSGLVYSLIVTFIAVFLVDRAFGNIVSPRYYAPIIPLVVLYPLNKLRNHKLVLSLAFIIQVYRLPLVRWALWVGFYLVTTSIIRPPYW